MRIDFCAYDFANYYNGPNSWMRRLLPQLRERGIETRLLFIKTADAGPAFEDLRRQGFDCHHCDWHATTQDKMRWILERVADAPPDVFVPNLAVPAYYAGRWIREAGIPTVGILHADDSFYDAIVSEFAEGDPRYRVSAMVCVSKWQAERLGRMAVRGLRIPYSTPIPGAAAEPPGDRLRLVYSGRFVEVQKRVSDLTRALCNAVSQVERTEAVLYGDGEARPAMARIIEDAKSPPVRLAGMVDAARMQDELRHCQAFVLLSDFEGLPISLLEAMACGVVPICLNIRSGIPELVEHDVSGLLVENRGDDFVAAVRRLRTEPGLWERLSRGARAMIAERYSDAVITHQWADLFNTLSTDRGRTPMPSPPVDLDLPPVHPDLACEDFRGADTIVGPRFSSDDFVAAGNRRA